MELLQKLRIKINEPLWLIDAPADCLPLFSGCKIQKKPASPVSQVLLFALNGTALAQAVKKLHGKITPTTLFWICYPKKTGAITSDLIHMKPWECLFSAGYRGQTAASVNDDWSALRVTNAPKKAPTICDVPMAERKMEGIDFVNRTVQLPADALAAMKPHKGMAERFNAMSFSHKKEHIEAIVTAKKPETRQRRIEKMVEMLKPLSRPAK